MSKNKYNTYGSFSEYNVKGYNEIPDGSLLNLKDNSVGINTVSNITSFQSPYNQPYYAYGSGPRAANEIQEYLSVPNKDIFNKTPVLREPSANNPFMNVMPLDYDMRPLFNDYNRYEKKTYPSRKNQEIKNAVKSEFERGLFQDADSLLWNRINSQRQYVSQPVGSVPNNQPEFANWLYGLNGPVCKSSSIYQHYGVKYTDDSLVCNGFNVAEPTNKGLLDGSLMSSVDQSKGI